jgi:uncharacterized protein YcbK (DUF882 family)
LTKPAIFFYVTLENEAENICKGGGLIFSLIAKLASTPEINAAQMDRRGFLKLGAMAAILGAVPTSAFSAVHRKDKKAKINPSRSLHFYNPHTGEKMDVSYFTKGRYSPAALRDINRIFRDFRTGAVKPIDPHLLDYLYGVSLKLETRSSPFHIISGYRSPETNAMLSRESGNVAKNSLHIQGKAVDIRLPDRKISAVRRVAVSLKQGGVGYYPSENFVHLDVGDIRYW